MTSPRNEISLSTLLYRHAPALLVFAVLLGAAAGALYSLVIPFVLGGMKLPSAAGAAAPGAPAGVGLFFGICLLILLAKATSVIIVNNIAKSATAELRVTIAKKINAMWIDNVEQLGFPRLLNILTDDVNRVASAAVAIPMLLVSTVTVLGMLAYLATLNLQVFALVVVAIGVGVTIFQVPMALATRRYKAARALRDVVQEGVRGLVMGVYELKLNKEKSAAFLKEELIEPQARSVRMEKIGDALIHLGGTASDMLSFIVIGLVVFVLPQYMGIPVSEKYGVVMALLYIAGPVTHILALMQQLTMGRVSLARIHALQDHAEETEASAAPAAGGSCAQLRVQDVVYRYPGADADAGAGFALAPTSLTFEAGQVHFIVGGNGSGKSTLSKLLSLHYLPASGAVYFGERRIDESNIAWARSRTSVIFSNYYLFNKLYRPLGAHDQARIDGYLEALALKGKTEFVDGRFTSTRLSDGQRRRLALLVALLEDKDIYIFDEWAADQDPEFKRIFYQEILQDMKRDNKLVIVITHDDRYFDCADQLVFMEDGRVTEVRTSACAVAPPGAGERVEEEPLPA